MISEVVVFCKRAAKEARQAGLALWISWQKRAQQHRALVASFCSCFCRESEPGAESPRMQRPLGRSSGGADVSIRRFTVAWAAWARWVR